MGEESKVPGEITSVEFGPECEHGRAQAHWQSADGQEGLAVMRRPREGEPLLPGERVLQLDGINEQGRIRAKEIYRNGPAQVSSKSYRDGWDAVFGKKAN